MRELIKVHSNKDDLVLDPFMGGGSTAIACLVEGRNFVGFERFLSKGYKKNQCFLALNFYLLLVYSLCPAS